jgi:hypothetical protein
VGGWACDDGVVLLAAPALQGILAMAPFLTAATFAKFDVLAVLAAAAVRQAEAAVAQAVLLSPGFTFTSRSAHLPDCGNREGSLCYCI